MNGLMDNFKRKDFRNHFEFGALVDHSGEMWSENEAAQICKLSEHNCISCSIFLIFLGDPADLQRLQQSFVVHLKQRWGSVSSLQGFGLVICVYGKHPAGLVPGVQLHSLSGNWASCCQGRAVPTSQQLPGTASAVKWVRYYPAPPLPLAGLCWTRLCGNPSWQLSTGIPD